MKKQRCTYWLIMVFGSITQTAALAAVYYFASISAYNIGRDNAISELAEGEVECPETVGENAFAYAIGELPSYLLGALAVVGAGCSSLYLVIITAVNIVITEKDKGCDFLVRQCRERIASSDGDCIDGTFYHLARYAPLSFLTLLVSLIGFVLATNGLANENGYNDGLLQECNRSGELGDQGLASLHELSLVRGAAFGFAFVPVVFAIAWYFMAHSLGQREVRNLDREAEQSVSGARRAHLPSRTEVSGGAGSRSCAYDESASAAPGISYAVWAAGALNLREVVPTRGDVDDSASRLESGGCEATAQSATVVRLKKPPVNIPPLDFSSIELDPGSPGLPRAPDSEGGSGDASGQQPGSGSVTSVASFG